MTGTNTAGGLDTNFGNGGIAVPAAFTNSSHYPEDDNVLCNVTGMAIQPNGKIVIAASVVNERDGGELILMRCNPNGSLDTSFGTSGGVIISGLESPPAVENNVAVDPQGNILVADGNGDVLCYKASDGSLYNSFQCSASNVLCGQVTSVTVQPLGSSYEIVVTNATAGTVWFNSTGTYLQQSSSTAAPSFNTATQSDGKTVAADTACSPTSDDEFVLTRYTTSGQPDPTFGTNGQATADLSWPDNEGSYGSTGVRVQSNGGILVVGMVSEEIGVNPLGEPEYCSQIDLARYLPTGSHYSLPPVSQTVTVNDVPPTVTLTSDSPVDEAQPLYLTGTITDPGFDNPLASPPTYETFPYTIDWGDGSTLISGSATITTKGSPDVLTIGSFDESHTYADYGQYPVKVTVTDSGGARTEETYQVTVTAPALPAPTALTATAMPDTEIDLTWADDNASNVNHYEIWRSPDDGSADWTLVGTSTTTSYDDKAVTGGEGTICYYQVRAISSGGGTSDFSNVASTTTLLATPDSLVVTSFVNGSEVDLAWNNNSTIETGYSIQELESDGVTWQEIQATTNTGTDTIGPMSVAVIGAFDPSATPYNFRVEAEVTDPNDGSCVYSAPSNVASATALAWAKTPTELTATTPLPTEIDLSWVDTDLSVTDYYVFRSTDGITWPSAPTETIAEVTDPSTTSYSCRDTGLKEGTTYYYRVQAVNGVGDSGYATATAATVMTPTDVHAKVVSGSEIDLTWTDNSGDATGYSIEELDSSGDWDEVQWVDAPAAGGTVTGPFEPNTTYSFQVVACSDSGQSQPAPAIENPVTTFDWPEAPTALNATVISSSEIDLSWTASTSTSATSYNIAEQSADTGDWTVIGNTSGTTFPVTTGLIGGTAYTFGVAAVNAAGQASGYCDGAMATTQERAACRGRLRERKHGHRHDNNPKRPGHGCRRRRQPYLPVVACFGPTGRLCLV